MNNTINYFRVKSMYYLYFLEFSNHTTYTGYTDNLKQRLKPLMQFLYQHMLQSLCHHDETTKHGVLFLLDDSSSLGKIETSYFAYARGYKVRFSTFG